MSDLATTPSRARACLWILAWSVLSVVALPLEAKPRSASLSGRILDPTGAAIEGATVTLRTSSAERTIKTDVQGSFSFEDVDAGAFVLDAVAPGFSVREEPVLLVAGESRSVRLTLEPGTFTETVTVMASRLGGRSETLARIPGSIDVIDSETLRVSRPFNFSEALRKASGVHVRDEEGFGLRPNIGIRGLNPTRSTKVLLLEDGVPVAYAPYGDNSSYYHPPLERFESIELLKGSGQIAYGPQTVGAVINYLTPPPPQKTGGWAVVSGGNRDYVNAQLGLGTTWGRTGLLFDVMRKQGQGTREATRSDLNDLTLKLVTTVRERHTFTVKGNYYGEGSNVTYSGLREDEYRARPRGNPFVNDFFHGNRVGGSLAHTYVIRSDVALTTQVYGLSFSRDWWRQSSNSNQRPNDSADPQCGGMANLSTTCGNEGRLRDYTHWGIEPRLRFGHSFLGARSEVEVGGRIHFETQDRRQENGDRPDARSGIVVEDNERKNEAYAVFVQNRFLLGSFTITPGLRLERVGYERTNRLAHGGLGVTGTTALTQWIPGLGVSYRVRDEATVFAGVHRGWSPPRTEDIINNTTVGVVDLGPERSWNFELGVRSRLSMLQLDATLFRMDYENQIVPATVAGGIGTTLTNGGETLHEGFEVSGRVAVGTLFSAKNRTYVRFAGTYLPVAKFEGVRTSSVPGFSSVTVSGNRLPYTPTRLLSLGAGYSDPDGFDALIELTYVSNQYADDLNTVEPSPDGQRGLLPAYRVWNAAVSYRIDRLRSTVFFTVKNLADALFIVDRSRGILPGSPRLVQAGVRFGF